MIAIVLVVLATYGLLGLAVKSRTRLRRFILALIAGGLLLLQAVLSMFAAVGGDNGSLGVAEMVASVILFVSAIASFVVMFRKPAPST